jgi:hypothetical protein
LGYCEKKSVETRLIGERVRGQRLFVKDEG